MKNKRLYAGLALSCAFVISVCAQPSQSYSAVQNGILEANLREAARAGNVTRVQRALTQGAYIDARGSEDRMTALHIAAHQGHEAATQILLQAGARKEMPAKHGETPLYLATEKGHATVVQLLLSAGACVNSMTSPDRSMRTALHKAAKEGYETVVRTLLDAGATVNVADSQGVTPLHMALVRGHKSIVRLLLHFGATFDICTKVGERALQKALHRGHEAAIYELFACGTVPLTASSCEDTLLQGLIQLSQKALIERKQATLTTLNSTAIQAGSPKTIGLPRELRNLITSMSEHADVASWWQQIDDQWCKDTDMLE